MAFDIKMDFSGFDDVRKSLERLATDSELQSINKKIVKKVGKVAQEKASENIKKDLYSKDPMKSGRKGSRTGQHAADNVPITSSTKGGEYGQVIGWEQADISPYFYMKFHEWGTSGSKPMHQAKHFMKKTGKEVYPMLREETNTTYEKELEKRLGK